MLTSCATGAGAGFDPRGVVVSKTSSAPDPSTVNPPSQSSTSPAPSTTSEAPSSTTEPSTSPAATERVVVLDPGHNGGNARASDEINRQVPAGRGRMKPCNTTGTSTDAGYAEHAFNFDVAQRVREALAERGIRVVLTRNDDDGVGPCVNRRAEIGNENAADAVVSIHADGHADASATGFHIAYSAPPLNDAQSGPAMRLARTMRDAMVDGGFPLSSYLGSEGLSPRDDLAGLNLSERPTVLVECGNMRNSDEAAAMATPAGRQRYAGAIADGIVRYLGT